jgi:hypothetical protein
MLTSKFCWAFIFPLSPTFPGKVLELELLEGPASEASAALNASPKQW